MRPRTIRGLMFSFAAAPGASSSDAETTDTGASPTSLVAPVASASPSATAEAFLVEMFADLRDAPVSDENAAELQAVLERLAKDDGVTAAVISPQGPF